jgi:uncharacterized protein (TIGR03067 family)
MRRLLLLFAIASLAFAPAPFVRRGRDVAELRRLQGRWAITSVRLDGSPVLTSCDEAVIEGDQVAYFMRGSLQSRWRISLNATSSPRKWDTKGLGSRADDATVGTYSLDGDALTLRYRFVVDRAEWVEVLRRK